MVVCYEDFAAQYESTVRAILRYIEMSDSEKISIKPPRLKTSRRDLGRMGRSLCNDEDEHRSLGEKQ